MLGRKWHAGTSKTKAGSRLLRVALFWKSYFHCASCAPASLILCHVTGWCKRPGAHHQETATTPYSYHGVFTNRSIFSLNLTRIQIPRGPSVSNCNRKHGVMLTCRHVHVRPHCSILMEALSCRLELAYLAGKISSIDWSAKMPLHRLIMGVAGS